MHFYMKVAGLRFFNPTRAILLYAWYASTLHLCLPLSVGLTSTLPHSPSLSSPFHPSWELFPWDLPSAYNKQTQITTFICLYNFLVFCNLSTYLYDKIRVFLLKATLRKKKDMSGSQRYPSYHCVFKNANDIVVFLA